MAALINSPVCHLEQTSSSGTHFNFEVIQGTPKCIDVQPSSSKSAELVSHPPEKPTSIDPPTLAERRNIPASIHKLRLHANDNQEGREGDEDSIDLDDSTYDDKIGLPSNIDSEGWLLNRIEKQTNHLKVDPRTISIDNSVLLDALKTHPEPALIYEGNSSAMEEDSYWENLIADYHQTVLNAPSELVSRVHGGLPHQIRGILWQAMAQSCANDLLIMYDKLISGEMGISSYEVTIERDVQQCFEQHSHILSENSDRQHLVLRFLKAYSIYDSRVGYCHGMVYLALPLLMNMPENQAFSLFVRLMEMYDMRTLFMLNMEGLHLRLHQFQTLLAQMCPQLDAHLNRLAIHPSMYATQWYLTLFSSSLPLDYAMRFYDLVFLEGAAESVLRLAISIMQKNEKALLGMVHFEQVIGFLSSSQIHQYETEDSFIQEIISLNKAVNRLDDIAESHSREIEREKNRAHQMLALRFGTHNQGRRKSNGFRNSGYNSSNASRSPGAVHDRTVPLLHQQIEDLVTALSQLQKEHTALSEANMSLRMNEMDQEAAQAKLIKRNSVLEKRVLKYKAKLASAPLNNLFSSDPVDLTLSLPKDKSWNTTNENKEGQFQSFVDSLRDTGEFGALIAGALITDTKLAPVSKRSSMVTEKSLGSTVIEGSIASTAHSDDSTETIAEVSAKVNEEVEKRSKLESALQNVTSELVAIKLAKFEAEQKYETLYSHYEDLTHQSKVANENETNYIQKIIYLQSELEDCQAERDQLVQDHEEMHEMTMVAKKTSAELQLEKLGLAKDVERLEQRVNELEEEKKAFFMPRSSFTEEVFAAHSVLFGAKPNNTNVEEKKKKITARRHTVQVGRNFNLNGSLLEQEEEDNSNEYKAKYVESELRCRELEKYLAEAKVKLAELESGFMISPRGSMQQRRASSIYAKRSSAASLSMLANRVSTPTSPLEPRESSESFASSTTSFTSLSSSNYNSKRSSMYSRIWNAFGAPVTPINPAQTKNSMMCEEPQIL